MVLLVGDPPVWVMTVSELPREMASGGWRGRFRPVKQFVIGWNDRPDARDVMLDGEPVGDDPFDLTVIAATIAGLCERDGVPEPGWVSQHRWAGEPRLVAGMGVSGPWSQGVVAGAPAVCGRFNVYYEDDWLESSVANKFPRAAPLTEAQEALLAESAATWRRLCEVNDLREAAGVAPVGADALEVAGTESG